MKKIIFCGCGGLYNYSLGIAKVIQDIKKQYPQIEIEYIGISAGCFPALLSSLELNIDELFTSYNKNLLENVNKCHLGSFINWYYYVKQYTLQFIPENSFKTNSFHISATKLTNFTTLTNEIFNKWDSNEDLVDCMIASSYIPIFGGHFYTKYKNNKWIDGTLTFDYKNRQDTEDILYIYPEKWRNIKYSWYYCYTDYKWAKKCYDLGIEDTNKNKQSIINFLLIN